MKQQQGKVLNCDLSEKKLEKKISQFMQREGWLSVKLMRTSPSGMPDRMFLKSGRTVFFEIKTRGAKPSPLQLYRLNELRENGFVAEWVDGWETFLDHYKLQVNNNAVVAEYDKEVKAVIVK